MTDDDTFAQMKLDLASALCKARIGANITQPKFASMLKSSQSRVSKMEAGDPSVSLELLVRGLLTLGVTRKQLARILSGAP